MDDKIWKFGHTEYLLLLTIVAIIFFLFALISVLISSFKKSSTKALWAFVVFILPIVGPILYFAIGRKQTIPPKVQKAKRPIIITIICCYLMLLTVNLSYSLMNSIPIYQQYISEQQYIDRINTMVGRSSNQSADETKTLLLLAFAIILVYLILYTFIIVGLWKMKKLAAYSLVGLFLLELILNFFQAPSQIKNQSLIVTLNTINLAACFCVIFFAILHNPKNEFSKIHQKQIGIISLVIGVILLIISQTADFTKTQTIYDLNVVIGK